MCIRDSLSLYEAVSFPDAIIIASSSILSFMIVVTLLFAIRERLALGSIRSDWKGAPLVLVSMGLLCVVLYATDVSWWLSEVVR